MTKPRMKACVYRFYQMNKLFYTIRMLLAGKHRLYTYSIFELIALMAVLAFFILMMKL